MKKKGRIIGLLFVFAIVASCAQAPPPKPPPAHPPDHYISKAQEFEARGDLIEALEQYKVALTVDPENQLAKEKIGQIESKLGKLAEEHYQNGLEFHRKGEYSRARQEFLTTLRFNPDHPEAKKMLQEHVLGEQKVKGYVVHTIRSGESISMLAQKYYGDLGKFQIIAEYNQLEDATKVRIGQEIKVPVVEGIPFFAEPEEIITPSEDIYKTSVAEVVPVKRFIIHTVQSGESLSKLALRYYGDYKKFPVIAQYNHLDENVGLTVGQKIKIPEIEGIPFLAEPKEIITPSEEISKPSVAEVVPEKRFIIHTVQSGESLSKLALRYYGDYKKFPIIAQYNNLDENVGLKVGQKIKIPEIEGALFAAKPTEEEEAPQVVPPVTSAAIEKPQTGEKGEVEEEAKEEVKEEVEEVEKEDEKELAAIDQSANYRELGLEFFNEKDYPAAISEFKKVLNINPTDKIALEYISASHFQQGLIVFAKEDYLTARDEFKAALQYNEDCEKCGEYIKKCETTYMDIHYNRGLSYFSNEKLAEAVHEWELVYEIDPEYKEVDSNLKKSRKLLERLESIKRSKMKE